LVIFIHAASDGAPRISVINYANSFYNLKYWGVIGVDLFYAISGFIMTIVIPSYLGKDGWKTFLIKRIVRILPLYYLITLFDIALALYKHHRAFDVIKLLKSLFFIPFFDSPKFVNPYVGVGWSLSYEIYFYLLICLLLVLKKNIYKSLLITITVLSAIGVVTNFSNPLLKFLTSPLLLEFGLGILCGLIFKKITQKPTMTKFTSAFILIAGAVLMCITLFYKPYYHQEFLGAQNTVENNNIAAFIRVIILGIPSAIFLLGVVLYEYLSKIKTTSFLILCGDSSYSCYLIHTHCYPAVTAIFIFLHLSSNLYLLLIVPLCLLISIVFYILIEKPLTKITSSWLVYLNKPRN
jgi:exopolysaccharide production protein ExoZ